MSYNTRASDRAEVFEAWLFAQLARVGDRSLIGNICVRLPYSPTGHLQSWLATKCALIDAPLTRYRRREGMQLRRNSERASNAWLSQ